MKTKGYQDPCFALGENLLFTAYIANSGKSRRKRQAEITWMVLASILIYASLFRVTIVPAFMVSGIAQPGHNYFQFGLQAAKIIPELFYFSNRPYAIYASPKWNVVQGIEFADEARVCCLLAIDPRQNDG
jgi:hypothetical protein